MVNWILQNIGFFMLIIICAGAVTRYIDFQHLKKNKYSRGDVGYFWRLMKAGDQDGIIVTLMSGIALCAGVVVIFALIYTLFNR